ncbi:hypothetical protein DYQ86_09215 [Acidobacteria bacterium AB60]|nr:hypothetical protein DYQ86_09215 [Acidobacteria bacterium AB60]
MRMRFQFVVFVLMALLVLEPATAGFECSMNSPGGRWMCAQMAGMSADCPMHHQTSLAACARDCYNQAFPSATGAMASAAAKLRLAPVSLSQPAVVATGAPHAGCDGIEQVAAFSASPPRHVLLHVFRI